MVIPSPSIIFLLIFLPLFLSEIHVLLSDSGIQDWEIFFKLWIVFKELIQEFKNFLEFHQENELVFVRIN